MDDKLQYFTLYYGAFAARFGKEGERPDDAVVTGWLIKQMEVGDVYYEYKLVLRTMDMLDLTEIVELVKMWVPGIRTGDLKFKTEEGVTTAYWGKDAGEQFCPATQKYWTCEQLLYLRRRRIDLYNLKDKGFAIYEKTAVR